MPWIVFIRLKDISENQEILKSITWLTWLTLDNYPQVAIVFSIVSKEKSKLLFQN